MSKIILVDMRENNGHIVAIQDSNDNIAQFDTSEDVVLCAQNQPLCENFPYIVVDMDTLEIE